ncbi:MAG: TenA family protein [Planctomycetota bacterium]
MSGPLSETLWHADLDLASACLEHPFVRGLADGTLPARRYREYVAQDAFFLRAFGDAYRLAAGAAGDDAGRQLYADLEAGIEEELELHRGMAGRLGIELDAVEPAAATLAYTEFLLATAATRPEPCTAAAMLPCLRLYAWLGQELLPALVPESPWADWVRTYADPGFEALWRRLAPRLDPGDADELARLHRRAMLLELRFFESAWSGGGPSRFDG